MARFFIWLRAVIQLLLDCWFTTLCLRQGCMELSGKHDKGGSHEELCRGHPAGRLFIKDNWSQVEAAHKAINSICSMYNDMYIYYASHIICIGLFGHLFPHHGIFSCSPRFWRLSRSQTKCPTWSRSLATSTPRSTETGRKLRSLTWTGDPSLDHLHNTQQVICMIVVTKETLMIEYKPGRVLSPCFTTDDSLMVRLVTNTRPGTHAFFFISRWAGSAIAEANNGRQVFVVYVNWVDVLVPHCLLCADPN